MEPGNSLSSLFSENSLHKFARRREAVSREESALNSDDIQKTSDEKGRLDEADENIVDSSADQKQLAAEDDARTLFVGNVPVNESKKKLSKLFSQYGEIDSIRIRSVPFAGTKVDEAGNLNLVKKVCANKSNFGGQKGSFNAYIKFQNPESVSNALCLNNTLVGDRHLRVDRVNPPSLFDPRRSIFVGNLPYYVDEEELRNFFAKALDQGQGDIEGVRLVRDPSTMMGKGFGYLLFSSKAAMIQALSLHDTVFSEKWTLRIKKCQEDKQRNKSNGSTLVGNKVKSSASTNGKNNSGTPKVVSINAKSALKRIKRNTSKASSNKKGPAGKNSNSNKKKAGAKKSSRPANK